MTAAINLTDKLKGLPLSGLLRQAGELAARQGQSLYLVGGAVRDLLLGQATGDLDLVLEGDAIALAKRLASLEPARLKTHSRFGTASLLGDKWRLDLVTARSETYNRPGALPTVRPGKLADDLSRRDFTVNAMAVRLNPEGYGQLIDPHKGQDDLRDKLIRVLHGRSFVDDATRIWRAIRYEQRLGFRIEADTLTLLKRDIAMLDTISGDRIRHELELALKEDLPEKVLLRAGELGALARIHPALKGNDSLAANCRQLRQRHQPPPPAQYLALLAYPLNNAEKESLATRLRLPRTYARILIETDSLAEKLPELGKANLSPATIYDILSPYSPAAIIVSLAVTSSPVTRERIRLYLDKLHHLRTSLGGADLKRMGVTDGHHIRILLHRLKQARLNGEITSKQDEEALARSWQNRV